MIKFKPTIKHFKCHYKYTLHNKSGIWLNSYFLVFLEGPRLKFSTGAWNYNVEKCDHTVFVILHEEVYPQSRWGRLSAIADIHNLIVCLSRTFMWDPNITSLKSQWFGFYRTFAFVCILKLLVFFKLRHNVVISIITLVNAIFVLQPSCYSNNYINIISGAYMIFYLHTSSALWLNTQSKQQ